MWNLCSLQFYVLIDDAMNFHRWFEKMHTVNSVKSLFQSHKMRVFFLSFLNSSNLFGKDLEESGSLFDKQLKTAVYRKVSQLLWGWMLGAGRKPSPSILGHALAVYPPGSFWLFLALSLGDRRGVLASKPSPRWFCLLWVRHPPLEHPGFLRLPVLGLSSLCPWPLPLEQEVPCCPLSTVTGTLWQGSCGAVFSQLTNSSSLLLSGAKPVISWEFHEKCLLKKCIQTLNGRDWSSLSKWLFEILSMLDHQWLISKDENMIWTTGYPASCLPLGCWKQSDLQTDQQPSLPFGGWVRPGIHCVINSVTRGQLCCGPEDTEGNQVWAAASGRYWW